MKNLKRSRLSAKLAFTLIELLVVIAIIAVLAALLFPAFQAIKKNGIRNKAKAELKHVETAIESYKARYGFYPPDNPGEVFKNQLFYELQGTVLKGNSFETLDGRERIAAASVPTAFGSGVAGFVNCTKGAGGDDSAAAQKFFGASLTPGQYGFATNSGVRFGLLTCSLTWPVNLGDLIPGSPGLNPFRYNSSSPVHNPNSFDLWVDVIVGGKTNRFCNWNADYLVNP